MPSSQKTSLSKTFSRDFKLNLFGSIIFECLKMGHEIALFYMIPMALYGLKGFVFSILYISINLTDLGFVSGLAPLIQAATTNKKNFKHFLLHSIFLQLIIFGIAGYLAVYFATSKFPTLTEQLCRFFIQLLIVTEGLRMFLRALLHTTFTTKPTVLTELIITTIYLSSVWIGYLYFKIPISLKLIFIPYAITSCSAVFFLFYLVYRVYQQLENNNQEYHKAPSLLTIFKTRITAYGLTAPKKLFTSNFIVPLLATTIGLEKIALIKYTSYLAESMHSLLRATIGFSGNALLSALQQTKHHAKRIAFSFISQKFSMIFIPFICFICFSLPTLTKLYKDSSNQPLTLIYTLLFLMLLMTDHLFLMYEQFYLMEKKAHKLLLIRALELALFYSAFKFCAQTDSVFLLLLLISIRTTSFITLATHAFKTWKLIPMLHISLRYFILSCSSAALATWIVRYMFL